MGIKPLSRKYEWFIHVGIVAGLWTIFLLHQPYALPPQWRSIPYLIANFYGVLALIALIKPPRWRALIFIILGLISMMAEIYGNAYI